MRLSGKEPEANIDALAVQDWRRNNRGAAELARAVSHPTIDQNGILSCRVSSSSAARAGTGSHYICKCDFKLFKAGRRPNSLDVSCTCMDHLTRGEGCKHGGAMLLYLAALEGDPSYSDGRR